jgi:hypothetical protein
MHSMLMWVHVRLARVDERLARVDERLARVDERLARVDERLVWVHGDAMLEWDVGRMTPVLLIAIGFLNIVICQIVLLKWLLPSRM